MAKNNNLTDFLTDVADTIRAKKGTSDLINPQDFSTEINGLGGTIYTETTNAIGSIREIAFTGLPKGKTPLHWWVVKTDTTFTSSTNKWVLIMPIFDGGGSYILAQTRTSWTTRPISSSYNSQESAYITPTYDYENGSLSFYAGSINYYFEGGYKLYAIY